MGFGMELEGVYNLHGQFSFLFPFSLFPLVYVSEW